MYHFIVNEHTKSGTMIREWRKIKHELVLRGVEHKAYLTKGKGDGTALARKLCRLDDPDIRIIVVGGDGTLNEVINGVTDFAKVTMGLIPLGSANDFAKGIGISTNVQEAMELAINKDRAKRIDLGEAIYGDESRFFAISSGIGMDAYVCKSLEESAVKTAFNKVNKGDKSYLAMTLKSLLSMERFNLEMEEADNEKKYLPRTIFFAAMNMPAEGGGVKMAPNASCFDGKLTMCAGGGIINRQIPMALLKLVSGHADEHKAFTIKDFDTVVLKTGWPVALHTDGEYIKMVTDITYKTHPAKLNFIV